MKDITKITTPALLAFQQIIEGSSMQMSDFFSKALKEQEAGTVSQSYIEKLERNLTSKLQANNEIDEAISQELHNRLINCFGRKLTTSKYLNVLIDEFTKEEESHKKLLNSRIKIAEDIGKKQNKKNKPILKMNTKISSEKKQ